MNDSPPLIVGLGEALYDLLPTGPALGGAPLNAAVQSHQLGNRAVVASRIGGDALGQALLHDLTTRGMGTAFIQRDPDAPTGTVEVILRNGEPEYDIVRNVAWDRLAWDESLASLAKQCDAVCFGTLGQRFEPAHSTIRQFGAASQSVRLFDLNLRQDFFSAELLEAGCRAASIVKMNETELGTAVPLLGLGQAEPIPALLKRFDLDLFVLTRGLDGTVLHTGNAVVTGQPAPFKPEPDADPVGAGDACSAAILHGAVRRWPLQKTADLANRLGAFVASRKGATPPLPADLLPLS
ncbi:MAG: PfkB family carbohydrate kinase [Verrucomicrobiota bacterium]|nr:PfkB family carbohydrate kinase [Verrucomicrobiota bacterium]